MPSLPNTLFVIFLLGCIVWIMPNSCGQSIKASDNTVIKHKLDNNLPLTATDNQ